MIVDYKSFPFAKGIIYRPMLQIKIYIGARNITTLALLDTGCDKTLINKSIGNQLFVDFKSCKKGSTSGVDGVALQTWESEVDLEIPGLSGKIEHVRINYASTPNSSVLLGHVGFFEYFTVKFDTANKNFDIIQNMPASQ